MGAYSLIANNELLHLGIFIMLSVNKFSMITHDLKGVEDHHTSECFVIIEAEADWLTWVHLISFVALLTARIYDFVRNTYESNKVELKRKSNEDNNHDRKLVYYILNVNPEKEETRFKNCYRNSLAYVFHLLLRGNDLGQILPLVVLCMYGVSMLNIVEVTAQCPEVKELNVPMMHWFNIE
jgi:hypothetical protein